MKRIEENTMKRIDNFFDNVLNDVFMYTVGLLIPLLYAVPIAVFIAVVAELF